MMPQADRFPIMVFASLFVFVVVLRVVVRKRTPGPSWLAVAAVAFIVVALGMTFARIAEQSGLPWWIYYGVPAAVTIFLPPIVLRLSKIEIVQYMVLAYASAPLINVAFSFTLGWHDYMPFMHVPYWKDLLHA